MEHTNATEGHILLVENDPSTREHLTHILEKAGFRITAPTDSEMVLELIRSGKFDLILLDIGLDNWGLDGRMLVHRMRDDGNQTPVILLTGQYLSEVDEVVGLEFGADDYIRKTVSSEVLIARIHRLLRRTMAGKRPLARFPKLNAGPNRPLVLDRKAKDASLHGQLCT